MKGPHRFEVMASGFARLEAPRVDELGRVYFSDIERGGVYRLDPDGTRHTVVPKRKMIGGILLHADGGIVVSGRDLCHVRDGESRVVFTVDPRPQFWNDLFADGSGRIYASAIRGDLRTEDPVAPGELWRIDAADDGRVLAPVDFGNGIAASPDGARLYLADTATRTLIVHDLAADGSLTHRRIFASTPSGLTDGVAVDVEGFVWTAVHGAGALMRFAPDGTLDTTVPVPSKEVTSLCFGGPDGRDLYITGADNLDDPSLGATLFRTRAPVAGVPVARVTM